MLGVLNLLPILKGWDYKFRDYTRVVARGQSIEVDRISTTGWLIQIAILSDDCHAGMRFKFQGSDLSLHEIGLTPYLAFALGALAQDPAGWTQLYYQPNPYSTTGAFTAAVTGGWEGFAMPFVPTTIIELYLDALSTQDQATIRGSAMTVEITDMRSFIRSLRSVLGMSTIMDVDTALLTAGSAELTVKGALEKKEETKT